MILPTDIHTQSDAFPPDHYQACPGRPERNPRLHRQAVIRKRRQVLQKILAEFHVLEITPHGFALPLENDSVPYELRQPIVKPYRILYTVTGKSVEILHVRHSARLPAAPEDLL